MSKFHIHVNRELRDGAGRPIKFYSEKDYTAELKRRNLQPYDDNLIKAPIKRKYTGVSNEARKMIGSVTYNHDGKPNIGDRYIEALLKMGVKKVPKELENATKGGWR